MNSLLPIIRRMEIGIGKGYPKLNLFLEPFFFRCPWLVFHFFPFFCVVCVCEKSLFFLVSHSNSVSILSNWSSRRRKRRLIPISKLCSNLRLLLLLLLKRERWRWQLHTSRPFPRRMERFQLGKGGEKAYVVRSTSIFLDVWVFWKALRLRSFEKKVMIESQ